MKSVTADEMANALNIEAEEMRSATSLFLHRSKIQFSAEDVLSILNAAVVPTGKRFRVIDHRACLIVEDAE
jgi:hypothetical protein